MCRLTYLLAGLVLFVVPLAAQQPQQTPRGRNPAISQVPAPPAERVNPKTVRPAGQSPPPSITIAFDRNPVRVGEESVVKLEPADVVIASPYVFKVIFGDDTSTDVPAGRADVSHAYRRAD